MANVNITALRKEESTLDPQYTYTDLALDLSLEYSKGDGLFKKKTIKDLKADKDYAAIRNSIFNILTTTPGQKILNPFFGCNLMQYLFTPVNQIIAKQVGNEIYKAITAWEPRVNVEKIQVIMDEESHQYTINLFIQIPQLRGGVIKLTGTLSNSGFYYISTT